MQPDNDRETILELIKVVDKAIMMERNARAFYRASGRHLQNGEARKMFDWLSDFEAAHESRLMNTRKDLFADPVMEGYAHFPVADDQTSSESRSSEIHPDMTEAQILMLGIEAEESARAYYLERADATSNDDVKSMLQHLARDEERHMQILSEQLKHLEVERFWMDWASFDESKKRPG
jgi:rubrerythrin